MKGLCQLQLPSRNIVETTALKKPTLGSQRAELFPQNLSRHRLNEPPRDKTGIGMRNRNQ